MRNTLNYLPAIVLPSLIFCVFFLVPLRRVGRARFWRETPCVIVSSSVVESATDSGLYGILLTYQYDFAGRFYSSSRYNFSLWTSTSGSRRKKRVAHRLAPGTTTTCYVNPDNPCDAVIERGLTWDMVGAGVFAITLFGVFLVTLFNR